MTSTIPSNAIMCTDPTVCGVEWHYPSSTCFAKLSSRDSSNTQSTSARGLPPVEEDDGDLPDEIDSWSDSEAVEAVYPDLDGMGLAECVALEVDSDFTDLIDPDDFRITSGDDRLYSESRFKDARRKAFAYRVKHTASDLSPNEQEALTGRLMDAFESDPDKSQAYQMRKRLSLYLGDHDKLPDFMVQHNLGTDVTPDGHGFKGTRYNPDGTARAREFRAILKDAKRAGILPADVSVSIAQKKGRWANGHYATVTLPDDVAHHQSLVRAHVENAIRQQLTTLYQPLTYDRDVIQFDHFNNGGRLSVNFKER